MAMEINGSYNHWKANGAEQMKEKQALERAEKAKEEDTGGKGVKASDKASEPQDEYISSKESGAKPTGLYRVGQDEDGRRKIFFDDPKKTEEKCVADTDQVDREIKRLKEKRQQLEQQIRSASGDPEKVQELERKLAQVENELSQKDNDTYRRQHTSVSR